MFGVTDWSDGKPKGLGVLLFAGRFWLNRVSPDGYQSEQV